MSDQSDGANGSDETADASGDDPDPEKSERERIREQKMAELAGAGADRTPVEIEGMAHFDTQIDEGVTVGAFHEGWDGPDAMLRPVVAAVAETMPATVATVDVEAHPGLAREYDVDTLPTVLIFSDGAVVERLVGLQDEITIGRALDQYL